MRKVSVELSAKQAQRLLNQLSPKVKIYLIRQWELETWPIRLRNLLAQIDARVRRNSRLARQALKTVGPARRALYARHPRY